LGMIQEQEPRTLTVAESDRTGSAKNNPRFCIEWIKAVGGSGVGIGGSLGLALVTFNEAPAVAIVMFMTAGLGAFSSKIHLENLFQGE